MNALAIVLALILAEPQTTLAAGSNEAPAVASSDDSFLAAWRSHSAASVADPSPILAAPFDRDGAPQRSAMMIGNSFSAPSLAWTGSQFLAAFRTSDSLQVRRIGKDGTPLAAATTAIPSLPLISNNPQRRTSIVWNGAHATVVIGEDGHVTGAMLNGDGSILRLLAIAENASLADAASALTRTLVVVRDENQGLSARLIDDGGNVSLPIAITSEQVAGAAVAGDGVRFLAVWVNTARQLRASSITADGRVDEPITLATIADFAALVTPSLTWDGHRFLVAWGAPIPGTFGSKPTAFFLAEVIGAGVGEIDIPHGGLGATALAGLDDSVAVVFIDQDGSVRERIHRGRLDNAPANLSSLSVLRRRPARP